MIVFNSYVKLPEGILGSITSKKSSSNCIVAFKLLSIGFQEALGTNILVQKLCKMYVVTIPLFP